MGFKRFVTQFRDNQRYTWSEGFYFASSGAELTVVKAAATALLHKRVRLIAGTGVNVVNAYVSDDDVVRDSLLVDKPLAIDGGTLWNKDFQAGVGNIVEYPDQAYTTVLLRMRSGTRTTKSMFMSGVADSLIDTASQSVRQNNAFVRAFAEWKVQLLNQWGWKGVDVTPGTNPFIAITNVAAEGGLLKYTTNGNHPFVKGDRVAVNKVKSTSGSLNATDYVTAVTAQTFTLNRAYPEDIVYLSGGQAQKRTLAILPIEEVHIGPVTNKKRGDSVGRRRGKRRTRR